MESRTLFAIEKWIITPKYHIQTQNISSHWCWSVSIPPLVLISSIFRLKRLSLVHPGWFCLQSQAVFSLWHLPSPLGGALGTRSVGLFGTVRWQRSRLAAHQINTACHTWFICMWGEPGRPQRSWLICHLQSPPRVSPGNFPAAAVPHFQTVLFDGSDDMQSDAERRGPAPGEICGCCCVYVAHTCYLLLLWHFLFSGTEVRHSARSVAHAERSTPPRVSGKSTSWKWKADRRCVKLEEQRVLSTGLVSDLSEMNCAALHRWCEGHPDQSEVGSIYCQCHFLR